MSTLSENLDAAKSAIRYLTQLKIRSNNRPHELAKWILKHPRSLVRSTTKTDADGTATHTKLRGVSGAQHQFQMGVDGFILRVMRHENDDLELQLAGMGDSLRHKVRTRRSRVAAILAGSDTPRQKRDEIKRLMRDWEASDGQSWKAWCSADYWHRDKSRMVGGTVVHQSMTERAEKKLTKFRYGNCGEKSATAYQYLIRNNPRGRDVLWVECVNWDHAFTVYGATGTGGTVQSWGTDAVIVDGWSEDYYAARHPYRFTSRAVPGPWQLWVRKQIVKQANALNVMSSHNGAGASAPPVEDEASARDIVTELSEQMSDEVDPFLVDVLGDKMRDAAEIVYMEYRERSGSSFSM